MTLLKQIAEIEGKTGYLDHPFAADTMTENRCIHCHYHKNQHPVWNPLTNWSDCGPLLEKYQLHCVAGHASASGEWLVGTSVRSMRSDPDLRTAIVKAIVESKR
jgi:hypothetical protein